MRQRIILAVILIVLLVAYASAVFNEDKVKWNKKTKQIEVTADEPEIAAHELIKSFVAIKNDSKWKDKVKNKSFKGFKYKKYKP